MRATPAMLASVVVAALSFSAPPCSRRDVLLRSFAGAAATTIAARPAFAEYYGEPPPKLTGAAYKEALLEAKEFKYAARPIAGNESEAYAVPRIKPPHGELGARLLRGHDYRFRMRFSRAGFASRADRSSRRPRSAALRQQRRVRPA